MHPGDNEKNKWCWVGFPSYARVILWRGQRFLSPLSLSNQSNSWSPVRSVAVIHALRVKEDMCSISQWVSPFLLSLFCFTLPFTCESTQLTTLRLKAVSPRVERDLVFITVLFITAVLQLWSDCAVHTDEVEDPVWACLDFNLWSFLFFLFFYFNVFFSLLDSLLICFPQVFQ